MDREHRLLDEIELGNGLTLFFHDESQPITGGRFQVRLTANVPIPLEADSSGLPSCPEATYEDFLAEMEGTLVFTVQKTRNFVAERDVPEVLAQMKQDFVRSGLTYLSRPDFAAKYTLKSFRQWQEEKKLKRLHRRATEGCDWEQKK